MDSGPHLPISDYWCQQSPDPELDRLLRHACILAWPYVVYCASRFLHDPHIAYDLMDDAVANARRYYERFQGKRTAIQLWHRICSVAKRLSKARAARNREKFQGSLQDLEIFSLYYSAKPQAEQNAIVEQLLSRLSDRSRQIAYWRLAGHNWEQIAERLGSNHMTVRRVLHREINRLLFQSSVSDKEGKKGKTDYQENQS